MIRGHPNGKQDLEVDDTKFVEIMKHYDEKIYCHKIQLGFIMVTGRKNINDIIQPHCSVVKQC